MHRLQLYEKLRALEAQRAGELQGNADDKPVPTDKEISRVSGQLGRLENIANSFQLVLPLVEIASVSFYIEEVHDKYFLPSPQEEKMIG